MNTKRDENSKIQKFTCKIRFHVNITREFLIFWVLIARFSRHTHAWDVVLWFSMNSNLFVDSALWLNYMLLLLCWKFENKIIFKIKSAFTQICSVFTLGLRKYSREPTYQVIISRFPILRIPRLDLENPRWNTFVGHGNSYVGIPMSKVGIPNGFSHFCPDFCLPYRRI